MANRMFEDFVDQLTASGQLQDELYELADDDGVVGMDEVADFARGHGFEFSAEELTDELDDDQLDAIAGGGTLSYPKVEIGLSSTRLDASFIKVDYDQGPLFLKFY